MAHVVPWSAREVEFPDGPFVACEWNGMYRIECRVATTSNCAFPDDSIYKLLRQEKNYAPAWGRDIVLEMVDWLNEQVRLGRIVDDPSVGVLWVVKTTCTCSCHQ